MKRRSFVKSSLLAGSLSSFLTPATKAAEASLQKKAIQEFYELRTYILKNNTQQTIVEKFLQNVFIPAYNRLGIKTIGVFTELKPVGQTKVFVLVPFKSLNDYFNMQQKLATDAAYLEAGEAYLSAPATAPAYDRIETSLMKAFEGMPVIELPAKKAGLYELRRYESANELAAKKKIEMFNSAGEIEIFKRTGLTPVFFGETLIGEMQPNLTYMIAFEDMAAHDRNWGLFGSDLEWKKISSIPEYADAKIVSRITSTFLVAAAYSQI